MADAVVFLDPPLWRRKVRIIKRFCKQQLGLEPCHYHSDLRMLRSMFRWTRDFEANRPAFLEMLRPYAHKMIDEQALQTRLFAQEEA